MSRWEEFMKDEEEVKEKEVKEEIEEIEEIEVKEEVIKPAVIEHKPIRHEPIIIREESLTEEEIRAYIDKRISLIFEKTRKEQKIEIDFEKVFVKLRSLDNKAKENAFYDVIIRRAKSNRKESYLIPFVSFINKYFDELKKT